MNLKLRAARRYPSGSPYSFPEFLSSKTHPPERACSEGGIIPLFVMGCCLSSHAAVGASESAPLAPVSTEFRAALTAELVRRRAEHGVASFNRMLLQFARLKVRAASIAPAADHPTTQLLAP